MATVITLPKIIGLDTELCVPEGNQRLWNYFSVEGYSVKHSKIFEPHLFMPTNKANLPYQKMVDRYQYLTSDGVKPQCEPLCPEGWYFDCETETCKEYSSYYIVITDKIFILKAYIAAVLNPPAVEGEILRIYGTNNKYADIKISCNLQHSYEGGACGTSGYFSPNINRITTGITTLNSQGSGSVGTLTIGSEPTFNTNGKIIYTSGTEGVKLASTNFIMNYSSSYVEWNLGELRDEGVPELDALYAPLGLLEAFACSEDVLYKIDIYGVK